MGIKSTMELAIAIMSLSGFLRGFAFNYSMLTILQASLRVGVATIMPCLPKLIAAWFPPEKLGIATGIYVAGFPSVTCLG